MTYTFDDNVISDLHKDAYGFRPSESFWSDWLSYSNDEKQKVWDWMVVRVEESIDEEAREQQASIARFEALVAKNIEVGAGDRETALRWIMDASDCDGDWERLCYKRNLPFNYFA